MMDQRSTKPGLVAAIYCRISADREGRELGVERQEEDCRLQADRLGCKVYRVYLDNDLSASTRSRKKRPEYQRLLRDAKAGLFTVVLAYTTSRLTRKPREHEDLIELAEAHGTTFQYVRSPSFDLNTANGRRIARMLAAVDAGEAEETAERVARSKLQAAQQGKDSGGPRPYCYESDRVTIRDSEAEIVKKCLARIIAGESQTTIVRSLNDTGIPSATGGRWSVANFKQTLTRRRFVIADGHTPLCGVDCTRRHGIRQHRPHSGPPTEYVGEWAGFIEPVDYALMMARFDAMGQKWAHGLANGRKYLLSGLARCGGYLADGEPCRAAMFGQARKITPDKHQRRYRCKGVDNFARAVGCGKVFRDSTALDAFVTECVLARFDSPDIARALTPEEDNTKADALIRELAGLNNRRRTLAKEHALKPYDDYAIMRETIMEEIHRVEAELGKLHTAKARNLIPTDQPVRAAWETATLEWRRDILKLVIDRIIVYPGAAPGSGTWNGFRFRPELIEIRWKV